MAIKLNIYNKQNEIEKTYEIEKYDLMYGTIMDIIAVLEIENDADILSQNNLYVLLAKVFVSSRELFENLLKEIFVGLTDEELRRTKIKEIISAFVKLVRYSIEEIKTAATEKN